MTTVSLDDRFPDHPKLVAAGPIAAIIQVRAICYCSRYLTDGWVPDGAVSRLLTGVDRVAADAIPDLFSGRLDLSAVDWPALMVRHGLWEKGVGGYHVHDFLAYNRSKTQVLADKAANRERQQRFTERSRANGVNNASRDSSCFSKFLVFYGEYPRKKARDAAGRAWDKIIRRGVHPDAILAGLRRQLDELKRREPRHVPYPATWLNAGSWEDEVEAPKSGPSPARISDAWQGQASGEMRL